MKPIRLWAIYVAWNDGHDLFFAHCADGASASMRAKNRIPDDRILSQFYCTPVPDVYNITDDLEPNS